MNSFKHFNKILIHKKYVFFFARKLGIGWQGFWHDMSKFSPVEFWESVKYYQGTSSPIDAAKADMGYSMAWWLNKTKNPIAMHPSNKLVVETVLSKLNRKFGSQKITDLTCDDWAEFRNIVDTALMVAE